MWPHQFTKKDKPVQIGEERVMNHTTRPIMAQLMICVHCHVEYVQNKDSQPVGRCPARSDKREMKRLKR